MGDQSSQLSIANSPPTVESVSLITKGLKQFNISLLTETTLVTISAILAIRLNMCRKGTGIKGFRFLWPKWTSLIAAMKRADADVY